MKTLRKTLAAGSIAAALVLSGCQGTMIPQGLGGNADNTEQVNYKPKAGPNVGTTVGAVAGALVGSQMGSKDGKSALLGAGAGAIIGTIVGGPLFLGAKMGAEMIVDHQEKEATENAAKGTEDLPDCP